MIHFFDHPISVMIYSIFSCDWGPLVFTAQWNSVHHAQFTDRKHTDLWHTLWFIPSMWPKRSSNPDLPHCNFVLLCELLFLRAEAWACSCPDAQDSILNPSWKNTLGLWVLKNKKISEHKKSFTHKWVCHKMWTEEKVCKSRHSS